MSTRRADKDKQPGPRELPWATLVFVRVVPDRVYSINPTAEGFSATMPIGYVLMQKTSVGTPSRLLWGFRQSFDLTPQDTAVHVVKQNIGVVLSQQSRIAHVGRLLGGNPESHWKHLFCVDISESEYERVDPRIRYEDMCPFFAPASDFYTMLLRGELYERHRVWLEQANLISEEQFRMTG